MSRTTQAVVALAALTAALAAPLAQAADQLTVARDPETGALRAPTSAEIDALKQQAAKQRAGSRATPRIGGVETRHADGSVERTLGDDDMMASVAVRQADGSIKYECLPAKQARQVVLNPKAALPVPQQTQNPQKDAAGHDLY